MNRWETARCQTGLSITQAAKLIGINSVTLRQLEQDDGTETADQHAMIMGVATKVYGVTTCWLAGHKTVVSSGLMTMLDDFVATAENERVADRDAVEVARVASTWSLCVECIEGQERTS